MESTCSPWSPCGSTSSPSTPYPIHLQSIPSPSLIHSPSTWTPQGPHKEDYQMEHHRDLIRTLQGFCKDCKRIKLNIVLQGLHKDSTRTTRGLLHGKPQGLDKDSTRIPQELQGDHTQYCSIRTLRGLHRDSIRIARGLYLVLLYKDSIRTLQGLITLFCMKKKQGM